MCRIRVATCLTTFGAQRCVSAAGSADVSAHGWIRGRLARRDAQGVKAPTRQSCYADVSDGRRPFDGPRKASSSVSRARYSGLERDLRKRGIVVGREVQVQVRPGPGRRMGESTDLLVEAVAGERTECADPVAVTVEVKGCWHAEVDGAMRTQLADRYLQGEGRRQAIYVVGWYAADDWDPTIAGAACARRDFGDTRGFFAGQRGL